MIEKAKAYAESHNISLSRLTEFIYQKITSGDFKELDEFPISDWVNQIAEGEVEYKKRGRKAIDDERVLDLEDGFEYYAAIQAGCTYIISEDAGDFHFSEIPVVGAREFLLGILKP